MIQLSKYLLRTLCSDLMNRVLVYLGQDCGLTTSTQELTPKVSSSMFVPAKKAVCVYNNI